MSIVHTPGLDSEQFKNNDSRPPYSPHQRERGELSMLNCKFSHPIEVFSLRTDRDQRLACKPPRGLVPMQTRSHPPCHRTDFREDFRSKYSTLKWKGPS